MSVKFEIKARNHHDDGTCSMEISINASKELSYSEIDEILESHGISCSWEVDVYWNEEGCHHEISCWNVTNFPS